MKEDAEEYTEEESAPAETAFPVSEFFVPDYFPRFSCKMGACRSACCVGWPISVSMKNYYTLLGISCDDDLRRRLDCGLRMVERPTEDCYARFNPRYDGNCPLRMEDGRCSIHANLGEHVLPDICRLYPRCIREGKEGGVNECSCAGSCEAVVELLDREEPVSFVRYTMAARLPDHPQRAMFAEAGEGGKARMRFLSVMQDRAHSIPERLMLLGQKLAEWDGSDSPAEEGKTVELSDSLRAACELVGLLDEHSDSIRDFGEGALSAFGADADLPERYAKARRQFEERFHGWETLFENLLVNHMFFSGFPHADRPGTVQDEWIALCATYVLMRVLCIGCLAEEGDRKQMTDILAAVFRLVAHGDFDRTAPRLLRGLGHADRDAILGMISL